MNHLKTYGIFESLDKITLEDVIQYYYDSFIELSDLGAFIGISDTKNLREISKVLNGDYSFFRLDEEIDRNDFILKTGIFGRGGDKKTTSEDLEEMYYYMKDNLLNNEIRFEELTGLKLINKYTTVTVREWDVYSGDKRYDEIVKTNSLKGRQHYKVQFGRNRDNRGYVDYNIYVNKGILYDRPSKSVRIRRKVDNFINWISGNKNKYNFPELKDNIEILQFEISHDISDDKFDYSSIYK